MNAAMIVRHQNDRIRHQVDLGPRKRGTDLESLFHFARSLGKSRNARLLPRFELGPVTSRWGRDCKSCADLCETSIGEAVVLGHLRDGALRDFSVHRFAIEYDRRHRKNIADCGCREKCGEPQARIQKLKQSCEESVSLPFTNYDGIDLSFEDLETLVRDRREDWMGALSQVKGVYLVTDMQTENRHVGCTFGEDGIWGRWRRYISTGHGGNVELRPLVDGPYFGYCRRAFRFSLLEHRDMRTPDEAILEREVHWKRVLLGPMPRAD
jgi:hypothetical protein